MNREMLVLSATKADAQLDLDRCLATIARKIAECEIHAHGLCVTLYALRQLASLCPPRTPTAADFKCDSILSHICHNRLRAL